MARDGKFICEPATDPQLSSPEDPEGKPHTDTPTLYSIARDTIFVETANDASTPVQQTPSDPQRKQFESLQELRAGEFSSLIRKLKRAKLPVTIEFPTRSFELQRIPLCHTWRAFSEPALPSVTYLWHS
ncbi:MAG: hypothetical protein Q9183_004634, partial [Haloplaca sp. 2 TL-2023]